MFEREREIEEIYQEMKAQGDLTTEDELQEEMNHENMLLELREEE
jgi:hypothetical protein